MRSAALALLALAPMLWGAYKCAQLKTSARQLSLIELLITLVRSELAYNLPLVGELVCGLAQNDAVRELGFLESCARMCAQTGGDFPTCWENAVLGDGGLCIPENAKRELICFGRLLGSTDADGQLHICDRYSASFTDLCARAAAQSAGLGKVYACVGIAAGLCVAIYFI